MSVKVQTPAVPPIAVVKKTDSTQVKPGISPIVQKAVVEDSGQVDVGQRDRFSSPALESSSRLETATLVESALKEHQSDFERVKKRFGLHKKEVQDNENPSIVDHAIATVKGNWEQGGFVVPKMVLAPLLSTAFLMTYFYQLQQFFPGLNGIEFTVMIPVFWNFINTLSEYAYASNLNRTEKMYDQYYHSKERGEIENEIFKEHFKLFEILDRGGMVLLFFLTPILSHIVLNGIVEVGAVSSLLIGAGLSIPMGFQAIHKVLKSAQLEEYKALTENERDLKEKLKSSIKDGSFTSEDFLRIFLEDEDMAYWIYQYSQENSVAYYYSRYRAPGLTWVEELGYPDQCNLFQSELFQAMSIDKKRRLFQLLRKGLYTHSYAEYSALRSIILGNEPLIQGDIDNMKHILTRIMVVEFQSYSERDENDDVWKDEAYVKKESEIHLNLLESYLSDCDQLFSGDSIQVSEGCKTEIFGKVLEEFLRIKKLYNQKLINNQNNTYIERVSPFYTEALTMMYNWLANYSQKNLHGEKAIIRNKSEELANAIEKDLESLTESEEFKGLLYNPRNAIEPLTIGSGGNIQLDPDYWKDLKVNPQGDAFWDGKTLSNESSVTSPQVVRVDSDSNTVQVLTAEQMLELIEKNAHQLEKVFQPEEVVRLSNSLRSLYEALSKSLAEELSVNSEIFNSSQFLRLKNNKKKEIIKLALEELYEFDVDDKDEYQEEVLKRVANIEVNLLDLGFDFWESQGLSFLQDFADGLVHEEPVVRLSIKNLMLQILKIKDYDGKIQYLPDEIRQEYLGLIAEGKQ